MSVALIGTVIKKENKSAVKIYDNADNYITQTDFLVKTKNSPLTQLAKSKLQLVKEKECLL